MTLVALYFKLVGARIRGQMQYKVSFWLEMIGYCFLTATDFAVIAILFSRFRGLAGWSFYEISVLYGMTTVSFGLAEMIVRGFDAPFETMMEKGTFDSILIRPLNTFFQILASELQLRRLGRTAQGLAILVFGMIHCHFEWTLAKACLLPVTVIGGFVIFACLFVMGGTICFWTIRAPEVVNSLTFGGNELTSYPFSIYHRWIRVLFIVFPVVFVNYPAALWILGKQDPHGFPSWLAWGSPLMALLFFWVTVGFWNYGVSKYQSTGS